MTAKINKLPTLDARLKAAADFVKEGAVAADIGCDHGKLAVALSAKCSRVIAVDLRAAPLASAKALVQRYGCSNVECRLGNGLLCIEPTEADAIIIAGLSAQTICGILAEALWIKNEAYRFVFVPATKHRILRKYLYCEGFEILEEKIVRAANRLYTVLHCAYTGKAFAPAPLQCVLGRAKGEYVGEYLTKEAGKLRKEAEGSINAQELTELADTVQTEAEKWQR